jgi:hypothetical protein
MNAASSPLRGEKAGAASTSKCGPGGWPGPHFFDPRPQALLFLATGYSLLVIRLFFALYFSSTRLRVPSNYAAKKKQIHARFSNANTFHSQGERD